MVSSSYIDNTLFALTRRTVTNKHVYWKQAIETGAMYLDFFSAPTNKKKCRIPNTQLQLQQLQPRRVFTLMPSDLCGHFKPCGKDLEV